MRSIGTTSGLRYLSDLLLLDPTVDLTGWTLLSATGISADGKTIVGYGRNPGGYTEGFIITLPEPSTFILLGLGASIQIRRTRFAYQISH
ncbi:MAG: hypothetical protein R3C45_01915 [Phycisphaerales bacterium]